MKVTDALLGEHAVMHAQFEFLEENLPSLNDLAQVKSLGAMLAAALASHAYLEDELLFLALEVHMNPASGPLAVMRMEHEEIESRLEGLQEVQDLAEAQNLLLHAIQIARAHFAREEQILYPVAAQMLHADTLELVGTKWAERRKVNIGTGSQKS